MLGFFLPLLFAASAYIGPILAESFGLYWAFLTAFLALVIIPLIDMVLPAAEPAPAKGPDWLFDSILVTYVLMHLMLIGWGSFRTSNLDIQDPLWWGIATSVGLVSGAIGVTFAHELIHRASRFMRFLGEVILVTVSFGHFAVAHVYGHHRNVGTPADPATAKKGQSIYSFFLHALPGVFMSAFQLKRKRTLIYTAITLVIAIGALVGLGTSAFLFFVVQSLIAILLTEITDYMEHYGLERKVLANGRIEPVAVEHSWDSHSLLTGKLLIHLQRHSDHHMHAAKKYNQLELPSNPHRLPTGYAGCLLVALIPPLWFRMMDPRI